MKSSPTVSPIRKVELGQFLDRNTMRLVREYPHPIDRVWSALTDPEQISVWWMPCSKLEACTGGKYVLVSPLGNQTFEGRIEQCDPPRLIDFSGVTRFQLFEHAGGCRLELTLKRWPIGWNPVSLAGFHMVGWTSSDSISRASVATNWIDSSTFGPRSIRRTNI